MRVAVVLLPFLLYGQSGGQLEVQIKDASGAPVAGVRAELTGAAGDRVAAGETDAEGVVVFRQLAWSRFTVRAERAGFQTVERTVRIESTVPLVEIGRAHV